MTSSQKTPSRIILIGFMTSGKTTVGQALAKELSYRFLDTDQMIEKDLGKSVLEIFEEEGESFWREQEKIWLKEALKEEKVVVATGGGIILDEENRRLIAEKGTIVSLKADPAVIHERIRILGRRPLLKGTNQLAKIEKLFQERAPYYEKADIILNTSKSQVSEIVQEIIKQL
ncbi:MAG: shikimate kinase [bacterium]|nr:shikimate kinase [bacterium]